MQWLQGKPILEADIATDNSGKRQEISSLLFRAFFPTNIHRWFFSC